ncbi:MAG: PadR family transcriptional regulator [Deltaproteobacteria bacterium]|nr:PadR family transcriptional regulator [Deltaproteobacteria bacterium]MBW2138453.1 PadR family transcriptional regulator [Deltaproteobacteria bacterium]
MNIKPSTQYVLLGSLMQGAKHGYDIKHFLESNMEATWRVGTSQLYALLRRMEGKGLLRSNVEIQELRPSRRIYTITEKGRGLFLDWLLRPVPHPRDFRVEFMGKLFFLHHLPLPMAQELIDAQIRELCRVKETLEDVAEREADSFKRLVYGFKIEAVKGALRWLLDQAKPFFENTRRPTKTGNTELKGGGRNCAR